MKLKTHPKFFYGMAQQRRRWRRMKVFPEAKCVGGDCGIKQVVGANGVENYYLPCCGMRIPKREASGS